MVPRRKQSEAAIAGRRARTKALFAAAFPIVKALKAKGPVSLRKIADALTERNIATDKGGRVWSDAQVKRVLKLADD